MKMLIDADGCPVVDIALSQASQRGIAVLIVCDMAHRIERQGVSTIVVSTGVDSADLALINRTESGDVVVTQDYGLAALCLAKGAHAIRQDGLWYTQGNIDSLLLSRHTARCIRRGGGRIKGPKKRTAQEDRAFLESLCKLLDSLLMCPH